MSIEGKVGSGNLYLFPKLIWGLFSTPSILSPSTILFTQVNGDFAPIGVINLSENNLKCSMRNYRSDVIPIKVLTRDTIARMTNLYLENYEGTSEALFRHDLAEKDDAIVLYAGAELVGFTTLQVYSAQHFGSPIRIVYSGDTIVHQKDWGQQELAFAWISRIGEIKAQAPEIPLYWFLLVKGHRTFKYLSAFGKSFFPHWKIDRSDLKPLADQLAFASFGHDYNPDSGVVEFSESRGHLTPSIAEPTKEEFAKESTRYFLGKNPGYRKGHELVCLCELETTNMKPFTARIFNRALHSAMKA